VLPFGMLGFWLTSYEKPGEIHANFLKFIFLDAPQVGGFSRKHIEQGLRYVQRPTHLANGTNARFTSALLY